ncbi:peptidase inhibitor family I36 protein [Glycomyces niveus]|uniref:Peptidase inhibitor family I36 protein n=1 Tax=Glycomyces niveus TaxID=2820287 RepID=A0ABS3U092_9ACTN|nr:peptidase inhibitor family I36 protein [Glycomyces sp. NEAU-S30]MBO3732195.1 peptidase inhibitor family I36 protein [Glycomyces sp. NEAU-S30]
MTKGELRMRKNPQATANTRRLTYLAPALAAAAILAAATPATAAPADTTTAGECPFTDTLCLFEGDNYTGERFTVSSLVEPGTCVSLVDHGWAGRVNSAINTNDNAAALFPNDDCGGGPYLVPGNSAIPDLGIQPLSVWVPA